MSPLRVEAVHKTRGGRAVLRGLDLAMPGGGVLALLGPSGCGKTTLLRLLAGFDRCDAGTIRFGGSLLDGDGLHVPPERRGFGYVPQEGLLFPHLSVAENVGFGLSRPERRDGRVDAVLRLVGLEGVHDVARRQPHQLSGGQQQRVALARALAPRPRLVLLDEPFNGLDGMLRRRVAAETAAVLRQAGATAVLVTHDPQEAFAFADHVGVMLDGRIAQIGAPADLYRHPNSPEIARLTGPTLELLATVCDGVADTPLGPVAVCGPSMSAGPHTATVLLRPEQVRVSDPTHGRRAEVLARVFAGSHTRLTVGVDGLVLDLQLAGDAGVGDLLWLAVEGVGTVF